MRKKRTATALKLQEEEKKPKLEVKHDTTEEEESEEEEETEEVEVSESEEVEEDDEEVEKEEVEEEEEVEVEEEEEEEEEEDEEEEEEEDDKSFKKETLRKLLEPLPKDKIIEFLKEVDPAHRKIFVFGLGWDATTDQVRSMFKKYGEIEECKVVSDKVTGKAKGYGFVLFKTRKSAWKSLKQTQKKIGSRFTTCQLASAGPLGPSNNQRTATPDPIGQKIFVANVGSHVNPNSLRSYFAKFGEIEEGPLGIDNATGKFKGFAMFVYKTGEGCKKALEVPTKVFDGCQLQCRQAVDGQRGNKNSKNLRPATSSISEIGNLGYGYGLYALSF